MAPRSLRLCGHCVFTIALVGICCVKLSTASRILLIPGVPIGSHYMFMAKIGELLNERGHNITMLINDGYYIMQGKKIEQHRSIFNFEEYDSVFDEDFMQGYTSQMKDALGGSLSFWSLLAQLQLFSKDCDQLLRDDNLFKNLRKSDYDLILANSFWMCHALVVHKLDLPFISVSTQRILPMIDSSFHGIPSNPSYTPAMMSRLTDKMAFTQRLQNLAHYIMSSLVFNYGFLRPFGTLKAKYNIRPDVTLQELLGSSEMAYFSYDSAYEFPRPSMPHAVHIGGLLASPASSLSKDWEEFVESASDGVVVFSLGSHADLSVNMEKAELFVRAFARLPQKVIVRYDGKPPLGLGGNTKLAKWIPQNDLLGHPNTKVFITHGGMNGVYEAIYHGIPVVGLPIFGDNYDNIARLVAKGMALEVDVATVTEDQLYQTVTKVVQDKSFKENAVRLSHIHRDQPMTPSESVVFWTEHVLQYGGQHLRPASLELNIFQYYLLDVFLFILILCAIVVFVIKKTCHLCCKMCARKKKTD